MKKFTVIALSLAALLTMSGCSSTDSSGGGGGTSTGGGTGGGTDTGGDPSQTTKFEGTWKGDDGFTLVIEGTTLKIIANNVENGISFNIKGAGNFTEEGTKIIQPNNKTVDKIMHHIVTCNAEMTLSTTDMVTGMNAQSVCGGGWKINTAKNVSACIMPGESKTVCAEVQEGEKDIFLLETNKLYSGDFDQGLDAAGYPVALETGFMTKQ